MFPPTALNGRQNGQTEETKPFVPFSLIFPFSPGRSPIVLPIPTGVILNGRSFISDLGEFFLLGVAMPGFPRAIFLCIFPLLACLLHELHGQERDLWSRGVSKAQKLLPFQSTSLARGWPTTDFPQTSPEWAPEARPSEEQPISQESEDDSPKSDEQPPRLLGDRFHGRGPLALEYIYTGEILSNTRGGIRTRHGTRYEGLLDINMDLDLKQIRPHLPGKLHLLFQHTHGRGLSLDFVGDTMILSTIDSYGNITQVSEYWWETTLGEDLVSVRLGKQDVNKEFHLVELARDFIHSANGIPATLPAPTYPDNSAAVVLLAKLTESLVAKAGLWDGYPRGDTWGFSDTGSTFTIVELERTHKLAPHLPGVFDLGFSHRSAINLPDEPSPEHYTLYFDFEQTLYREDPCDKENPQGLGGFFRFHTDFPRREVECKEYFAAGLVYQGLLRRRDDDRIGLAVHYLRHNLGGTGQETATEVFYKFLLTPWATFQPVLQYISTPSGRYRDAFVVGLRFQITL